jgi:DnaJ-domain-containing protein 1
MDLLTKLLAKMLARTQKGMAQGMQEAVSEVLDELTKGALDPAKLAEMLKSVGVDPSQFSGMGKGAPGFDAYKVLGLDKSATDDAIKKRYRELLHKLHPDTSGTTGTEFLLQMVVAAYEMIKKERGWQ